MSIKGLCGVYIEPVLRAGRAPVWQPCVNGSDRGTTLARPALCGARRERTAVKIRPALYFCSESKIRAGRAPVFWTAHVRLTDGSQPWLSVCVRTTNGAKRRRCRLCHGSAPVVPRSCHGCAPVVTWLFDDLSRKNTTWSFQHVCRSQNYTLFCK